MRTCEAGTPLVAACGLAVTDRGHRATGSLASHARMHARTFLVIHNVVSHTVPQCVILTVYHTVVVTV